MTKKEVEKRLKNGLEFLSELQGRKVTLAEFQNNANVNLAVAKAFAELMESPDSAEKTLKAAAAAFKKYQKALDAGDVKKMSAAIMEGGDIAASARYAFIRPISKAVEEARLSLKKRDAAEKALVGLREAADGLTAAIEKGQSTARWVKKIEAQKAAVMKYII